ncbi:Uncharacterised protein [Vibrio cholerae]|nr:Uncharacterised protein [Vibrio cholerae]
MQDQTPHQSQPKRRTPNPALSYLASSPKTGQSARSKSPRCDQRGQCLRSWHRF